MRLYFCVPFPWDLSPCAERPVQASGSASIDRKDASELRYSSRNPLRVPHPPWSRETFRGRSVTIEELECSILARPCTVPVCAVSRRNRDGGTRIVGAQRAVPRRGSSARNPRDSEPAGLRVSEREPPPETLSQAAQCRGALALSSLYDTWKFTFY